MGEGIAVGRAWGFGGKIGGRSRVVLISSGRLIGVGVEGEEGKLWTLKGKRGRGGGGEVFKQWNVECVM